MGIVHTPGFEPESSTCKHSALPTVLLHYIRLLAITSEGTSPMKLP